MALAVFDLVDVARSPACSNVLNNRLTPWWSDFSRVMASIGSPFDDVSHSNVNLCFTAFGAKPKQPDRPEAVHAHRLTPPVANNTIAATHMRAAVVRPRALASLPLT